MLSCGASILDNHDSDDLECSFAIEYQGPPLHYHLPQAIPIDTKRIPVASVASRGDQLPLPVVQPLIVKNQVSNHVSSDSVASPTSVVSFEGENSGVGTSETGTGSTSVECTTSSFTGSLDGTQQPGYQQGDSNSSDNLGASTDGNDDQCQVLSTDSASGSSHASSEICRVEEESGNLSPRHARRGSRVTFQEEDSTTTTTTSNASSTESEYAPGRRQPEIKVHNTLCNYCCKGNWFRGREVCLVCNAKYCSGCVLRAMGSMPEGRKCLPCIGYPIDESKRRNLGKCSRMLKRLLSELEIRQIMEVEKLCQANQLRANHVYINGKRLSQEELILLQRCPNPPRKLKPGHYWYDNVSGLWGEEGHKPCRIISPRLNIGGSIMRNASNGDTNVVINNREITKVELRFLRFAGVECAGNPHFWLDEDGSYREEGQKNPKGNIWDKPGAKLFCVALSLPIPTRKVVNPPAEVVNKLLSGAIPEYIKQQTLRKLLLVGYNGSGTSTIFKQAKMLYKAEPFSEDERQEIKFMIQRNVYKYLAILLEGRERLEDENLVEMRRKQLLDQPDGFDTGNADERNDATIYSISPRQKAFSDWLLKVMLSGNLDDIFPAASREYAPLVEELWKSDAIQATFAHRSKHNMLPSVAGYFLERAIDISRADYEPSDLDILYAEGLSLCNGITSLDFSLPRSEQQGVGDAADQMFDPVLRYRLIRVGNRGLGEHCKWLEMFEDVRMVIFCVALSDYDQVCGDRSGVCMNKILASKKLFENIISHPTFKNTDFLLVLTKFDMLVEKIEQVPLSECSWFDDFNLLRSNHNNSDNNKNNYIASPGEQAFHYIAAKFKKLFCNVTGRKLYVSLVNGLEPDSIKGALIYAREILKWDEEKASLNLNDFSYSGQTTTS